MGFGSNGIKTTYSAAVDADGFQIWSMSVFLVYATYLLPAVEASDQTLQSIP
jgi:hypothetical protein